MKKYGYRCHEVGGSALTVCVLMATGANSILVKGSANLLSFPPTRLKSATRSLYIHRVKQLGFTYGTIIIIFLISHSCCVFLLERVDGVYASLLRVFIQHFVVFSSGSESTHNALRW